VKTYLQRGIRGKTHKECERFGGKILFDNRENADSDQDFQDNTVRGQRSRLRLDFNATVHTEDTALTTRFPPSKAPDCCLNSAHDSPERWISSKFGY